MKNILTFVVLCLCSLSLMGQISTANLEQQPKAAIKSQPTFKVRLDSTIIVKYDKNGETNSQTKYFFAYNSHNKLASLLVQQWEDGKFDHENANEYIYDSEGNISKQYAYTEDKHGTIGSEVEVECVVDSRGNITESNSHIVSVGIMEFEHRLKTENTYNKQEKKTEYTNYEWDNEESEWKGGTRVKSIYDTEGKEKQDLHYRCNQFDCTWKKKGKTDYIYDAKGRKSEIIHYNWLEKEIVEKERHGRDLIVSSTTFTGEWDYILQSKTEVTYDAQGRNIQEIDYNWNIKSKQWLPSSKEEAHFDDSHDGSPILRRRKPSKDKLTRVFHYKWSNSDSTWKLSSKTNYHYSNIIQQDKLLQSDIIASPNPAEDFVIFDIENTGESFYVKLYDMQGKLLISRKLYAHNQLSVSHLSSGAYFYQLHHNNQIHTGKIIIK